MPPGMCPQPRAPTPPNHTQAHRARALLPAHPIIYLTRDAQLPFHIQLQPVLVPHRHGTAGMHVAVLLLRRRRCRRRGFQQAARDWTAELPQRLQQCARPRTKVAGSQHHWDAKHASTGRRQRCLRRSGRHKDDTRLSQVTYNGMHATMHGETHRGRTSRTQQYECFLRKHIS